MKILSITFLIFFISFFSQDEPVSKIASLKIPNKSERMNRETFKNYASKKIAHAKTIENAQKIFKSNDIVITIDDRTDPKNERSLKNLKSLITSEAEELIANNEAVEIIKENGNDFLIRKRSFKGEFFYTFYSQTVNGKWLEGSVIFKDKANGERVFYELIKSVVFKKQ